MPIASRFRHSLVIHRHAAGTETDARGDRVDTLTPQDPIPGLIQRRSSRELVGDEPAGVALSDAWAFLPITAVVAPADYIQEGSSLYQVVGPARDAGGRGRHLEADLLLVVP